MLTRYTCIISSILAAVLSPGAALAGQLTVKWVEFPKGNSLVLSETVGSLKMTADEHLYQKGEGPNNNTLLTYEFLYWNKGGTIQTDRTIDDNPGDSDTFATAWYLETGGGQCAPNCFGTTWAFSSNDDGLIAGTPIGSVSPSGLWTTPSTTFSTNASSIIMVDALNRLGPDPNKFPSPVFQSWLVLSGKPPIKPSTSQSFTVTPNTAPDAIAFYLSPPTLPPQPKCPNPPCPLPQ
jgi:hypothetical protein